jgi:hypothetical protein
MRSER